MAGKNILIRLGTAIALLLLLVPMLLPTASQAQNITLPRQAEGTVPVSDMTVLARLMAYARSTMLLAYLDALEQILPPMMDEVRGVLGNDTPQIPDITSLKKDYLAKLNLVAQAATIADAEAIINGLQSEAQRIQGILLQIPEQLQPLASVLQERGMSTKDEITEQIQAEVTEKAQAIEDELNQEANSRAAAFQAEIQAEAEQLASQMAAQAMAAAAASGEGGGGGAGFDMGAMMANFQAQLTAKVTAFTNQLTDEMNQLGKQKEAELRAWADQRVEELKQEKLGAYFQIRDDFSNINDRITSLVAERQKFYESYYQQFKDRKVEVIKKAMQPQLQDAIAKIKQYGPDLALAQKEGRGLPTEQQLLNELQTSWDKWVQTITNAEYSEDIDQAVASFKAYWQDKQAQLELARSKGSQEVITTTLQKLKEQDAEGRLSKVKSQLLTYISQLEDGHKKVGSLTSKETEYLNRCKALLPLIDEGNQLIAQFKQAKPTDDIKNLLALKDQIISKLEQIQQSVNNVGDFPAGNGIFIEAENESYTKLLPRTEPWHSAKEINPKPTWRPEPSGWADWYLSRGGELLGYYFNITAPGTYTIWIRDLASTDHPASKRAVTVQVDGKSYGSFPEYAHPTSYPKGVYGWHTTARVNLGAGKHTLELIKTATTSAAAIIDCIYITSNPNEVPK